MEILLCLFYTIIFLVIIRRSKFFRLPGLGTWTPSIFFLLKIAAGIALWALYTFYYTDPSGADIYKYFSDGKIMFGALKTSPGDYFSMLFGVGNNTPHFDALYYQKMDHWYREFDSNLYNDSHTIIRFNALVNLFSFGYFNVHTVFMCFISFTGLCAIYKALVPAVVALKRALAVGVFLVPSVLFWSSGVLKEGFLFFGMGLLLYHFLLLIQDRKWWRIPLILLCLLLLFVTKFYIVVSLLPALIGLIIVFLTGRRFVALKFLAVLVVYLGLGLLTPKLSPGYDPLVVLTIKQHDMLNLAKGGTYLNMGDTAVAYLPPAQHDQLIKQDHNKARIRSGAHFTYYPARNDFHDTTRVTNWNDTATLIVMSDYPPAGSLIKTAPLEPTLACFAKAAPVAVIDTLLRPFPWEARSLLLLAPAFENVLIILLLILAFFFRKKNPAYPELIWFCIIFTLLLFAITGLTTPVTGALVRYKIPGLPFLIAAVLLWVDEGKVARAWARFGRRTHQQ